MKKNQKLLFVALGVLFFIVAIYLRTKSLNSRPVESGTQSYKIQDVKYLPEFISSDISWKNSLNNYIDDKYKGEINPIKNALIDMFKDQPLSSVYLAVQSVQIDSKWLELSGVAYSKETNEIIPSEGIKVYGEKLASGWKLFSPGEEGFCDYAKRAPKDWVDPFFLQDCK
jgi:hypothetical protein